VSVVIPTRHEAATIEGFLGRVLRALDGIRAEVIVVDDSDHDNTLEVLLRVGRRAGEHVVILHRPAGSVAERTLGTAVVAGIRMARGEFVCVMDADGQHPPEVIPAMVALAMRSGVDYVGGTRYARGGSAEGFGAARAAISRGLALATRAAFLLTPIRNMSDPLSGFFLFRRALVDGVDLRPIGWKISLEILVRARVRGLAEAPYALVTFQALGFDALTWPIWASTELAILWNYTLNRRVTWRERTYGRWWLYNIAAIWSSLLAIGATVTLGAWAGTPLWLGSIAGITVGMAMNYLLFDKLVFAGLSWLSVRFDVPILQPALPPEP
jgi:glycosyltransferase involved in cell wall biosynthesis